MARVTLLSGADMVYLRAEAENLLPDTCDIMERQISTDGVGGYSEAWSASYQGIPCRLSEAQYQQREGVQAAREGANNVWVLTLPYDQAIGRDDRVLHNAVTYEIIFVNEGRSYDTVRRVQLRRID